MSPPFSPMLAVPPRSLSALKFPLLASPKLDGMRCALPPGGAVTKSGKALPNTKIAKFLSASELKNLDGELIWGDPVAPDVVQRSIAAGMAAKGPAPERGLTFYAFDHFGEPSMPFTERWKAVEAAVAAFGSPRVQAVAQFEVNSLAEMERIETAVLAHGFEGIVLRRPDGHYKFGRTDPDSRLLLKVKRRSELVAEIVDVVRRRGRLDALVLTHPDYPEPFEVPVYTRSRALDALPDLRGRKAKITRHPGSWKRAPRSPLFETLVS